MRSPGALGQAEVGEARLCPLRRGPAMQGHGEGGHGAWPWGGQGIRLQGSARGVVGAQAAPTEYSMQDRAQPPACSLWPHPPTGSTKTWEGYGATWGAGMRGTPCPEAACCSQQTLPTSHCPFPSGPACGRTYPPMPHPLHSPVGTPCMGGTYHTAAGYHVGGLPPPSATDSTHCLRLVCPFPVWHPAGCCEGRGQGVVGSACRLQHLATGWGAPPCVGSTCPGAQLQGATWAVGNRQCPPNAAFRAGHAPHARSTGGRRGLCVAHGWVCGCGENPRDF